MNPIDPTRTAMLILDMHVDVLAADGASADSGAVEHARSQNVVANISSLADRCRTAGIPVVHVHHRASHGTARPEQGMVSQMWAGLLASGNFRDGTHGLDIVPPLEPREGEMVIVKERASAFFGTSLDSRMRAMGIDTLIVTGAWTNFSVESTARYGADAGYRMIVASDGTSTISEEWHRAATEYALTWLAEVQPVSAIEAAIET